MTRNPNPGYFFLLLFYFIIFLGGVGGEGGWRRGEGRLQGRTGSRGAGQGFRADGHIVVACTRTALELYERPTSKNK